MKVGFVYKLRVSTLRFADFVYRVYQVIIDFKREHLNSTHSLVRRLLCFYVCLCVYACEHARLCVSRKTETKGGKKEYMCISVYFRNKSRIQ